MHSRMLALAALIAACALAGCPKSGSQPAARAPTTAEDLSALSLPLRGDADAAHVAKRLARLGKRADAGDLEAAWGRVHYLIDLFDDARFAKDEGSLQLLHEALGTAPAEAELAALRGPQATDQVAQALLREIDRALAIDRLHIASQAARVVVTFDSQPPTSRAGLLQRMAELKRVARAPGPLAANAALRLAGYCYVALADATRTRYAERIARIAHCLYPLYDADPEPYFAKTPALRPPPPGWRDLADRASALIEEAAVSPRLARAASALGQELRTLIAQAGGELPALPDLAALNLASAEYALPYDWTPLITLGEGRDLSVLKAADALTRAVQGDGRQTLAVALSETAFAGALARVAEAAVAAGATRLELAVASEQMLQVPPGDYWHGRIDGNTVKRLSVIGLSLDGFTDPSRWTQRSATWDPSRAALRLYLLVGPERWQVVSPQGALRPISARDLGEAQRMLRIQLASVYQAFPEEDAVLVVPEESAALVALARALDAVRYDDRGRELLSQVGLARAAPPPSTSTGPSALATRVDRRDGALVDITPEALLPRIPALRACYQDVLEKTPSLRGSVRVELRGGAAEVTQGPRDAALRQCVLGSVAEVMKQKNIASAMVELRTQP